MLAQPTSRTRHPSWPRAMTGPFALGIVFMVPILALPFLGGLTWAHALPLSDPDGLAVPTEALSADFLILDQPAAVPAAPVASKIGSGEAGPGNELPETRLNNWNYTFLPPSVR